MLPLARASQVEMLDHPENEMRLRSFLPRGVSASAREAAAAAAVKAHDEMLAREAAAANGAVQQQHQQQHNDGSASTLAGHAQNVPLWPPT